MSRTKAKDLRNLTVTELGQKEQALRRELYDLQQKKVTGQLEKPSQFKAVRRNIAQIQTVIRGKQKGA